jgi:hypothetical protein
VHLRLVVCEINSYKIPTVLIRGCKGTKKR